VLLEGREDDVGKNERGRKEERRNHPIMETMINSIRKEVSTFHRKQVNATAQTSKNSRKGEIEPGEVTE
jgi:hypothetical protein